MAIGSILFAAGEGKRLRPLTEDTAKPALPILDVPLGAWGLAALLRAAGPVVVNASHQAGGLEATLRRAHPDGWELFDEGPEGFGTGGTVAALADRMSGPVVLYNGDLLSDLDPVALLATHRTRGAGITLAVRRVERGADMRLSGDEIAGFIDRRSTPDAPGAQYLGVAVIEAEVARRIPKTRPLGLGESVFGPLAGRGWLAAHVHDGYALDVGTVNRYLQANIDVLNDVAPPPPRRPPGHIKQMNGQRAYVGEGATAADASVGGGAVLLEGSTVADGARVQHAVVWRHEVVPEDVDVNDAVWIDGRSIAAGG
ncbi:MAG: NDP-sugar synthase [Actinobacteria bacterium]|nr:NDP-sugar synthase [Actinomycetota bacterium]